MEKYNYNYILTIEQIDGDVVVIKPPLTLDFDIERKLFSNANSATFRITNLGELTRNKLQKDYFSATNFRALSLRAGYGDNLAEIFTGTVSLAWSERPGEEWVTTVSAYDGGRAVIKSSTSLSRPKGTPYTVIISDMMKDLEQYGVKRGVIGDFPGKLGRDNSFSGPTIELLQEITGGAFFIDGGVANAIKDREILSIPPLTINSKSGLLGTPRREQTRVELLMLFEPFVQPAQRVILESLTNRRLNFSRQDITKVENYKVCSVAHKGVISGSVPSSVLTTLELATAVEFKKVGGS